MEIRRSRDPSFLFSVVYYQDDLTYFSNREFTLEKRDREIFVPKNSVVVVILMLEMISCIHITLHCFQRATTNIAKETYWA